MTQTITKEIPFLKSMGDDERNTNFAQVRSKMLDKKGMFPLCDFELETLSNIFKPEKLIVGDGLWAIGVDNTRDIAFYSITTGSSFSENFRGGHATDDLGDAMYYNDGTGEYIYGLTTNGNIFKFNTNTYVYTSSIQSLSGSGEQLVAYHPLDDKAYFLTNKKIYRYKGIAWDGEVFNLPKNFSYKTMFPYKDQLAIVGESDYNNEVRFMLWNTESTQPKLTSNILIGYGRHIGTEVLEETITSIINENRNGGNKEEYEGFITVKSFNGAFFSDLNKINIDESQIINEKHSHYSDGKYLYLGMQDGTRKAGIYRFDNKGSISIKASTSSVLINNEEYHGIAIYFGILVVALKNISNEYKLAQQYTGSGYTDFADGSEYTTPFYGNPAITKNMESFTVSFTQTFDGSEEGHVYYRTNKKADWVELWAYNYGVDGVKDRKTVITNSTIPLPEFKEIQFKFNTKFGLNITSAEYTYQVVNNTGK